MKTHLLVILLLAWPALAMVEYDPGLTSCSSHPCTITVTIAGAAATAGEKAELQAVFDEVGTGGIQRGDTIKLEAGKIWETTDSAPYSIEGPITGSSGYITLTSTGTCPDDGVIITPDYNDQLGYIRVGAQNIPGLFLAGSDNPAEHIRIKCLGFESKVESGVQVDYNGALFIGHYSSSPVWSFDVDDENDQPDDIIVDQIYWRNVDWLHNARTAIRLHGRAVTIKNSWLDGCYGLGEESQCISGYSGVGPFVIENNLLANASENLFYGGAPPAYDAFQAEPSTIRWNRLIKIPERFRARFWFSNIIAYKGRVIKDTANTMFFQAQNSGQGGSTEPLWNPDVGDTTVDGDVTWKRVSAGGTVWPMNKNAFEAKWWNVNVVWNLFMGNWVGDAGQYSAIVLKSINHGAGLNPGCAPYFSGTVNTDGTTITSADSNPLPWTHWPSEIYGTNGSVITIDSTEYDVTDFDYTDQYSLEIDTDLGSQADLPYEYGQANCYAAQFEGTFRGNHIRDMSTSFALAPWWNAQIDRVKDITITNNLMEEASCKWANIFDTCWGFSPSNGVNGILIDQLPPNVRITHNTSVSTEANAGTMLDLDANIGFWRNWANDGLPNTAILDNIFAKLGSNGAIGAGTSDGHATIRKRMCDNSPCPATVWDKNIIAGIDEDLYADNDIWNLCPSPSTACDVDFNYDDPTYGRLFENMSEGIYVVRHDHSPVHYAKNGGTDGKDLGADMDDVPSMRVKEVVAGDTEVLVRLQINRPIELGLREGYHCVAYVNTAIDYYSGAGYSGSTADAGAVIDGYDVTIPINGLTADTQYQGPWIQCPGAMWPTMEIASADAPTAYSQQTVTTTPAASGSWTWFLNVHRTGDFLLQYDDNPEFSSASETSPVSCSGPCTLSVTLDEGTIYYARIRGSGGSPESRVWTLIR